MTRRSKRPGKIDESPEAMARRAERRLARERQLEAEERDRERAHRAEQRKIKVERGMVLHHFLRRYGSAGLIIGEDVDEGVVADFREGFQIELTKRLLMLPADGTIQGEERDNEFALETLGAMSAHHHAFGGTGVIGFEGTDFSGQSGEGTPEIATHVASVLNATGEDPRTVPAIVAFGTGTVNDMPTSAYYDRHINRGIVDGLAHVLALDEHGEPKTMVGPSALSPADAGVQHPYAQASPIDRLRRA